MEEEVKNTVDNSVNNLEKISAFVINYLDELLTNMHLEVKITAETRFNDSMNHQFCIPYEGNEYILGTTNYPA